MVLFFCGLLSALKENSLTRQESGAQLISSDKPAQLKNDKQLLLLDYIGSLKSLLEIEKPSTQFGRIQIFALSSTVS